MVEFWQILSREKFVFVLHTMLTSSSTTGTLERFDAVVSVVRAERTLTDEQNFDRSATSGVSIPSREVIFFALRLYLFMCI